ncbi:uncharacterized protein PAC_10528 [Phialocephala subalpina]|uniref:Uncharacterized protein n=1 Tax=Phialocephala subalpina TaxID=576137 RepID=A0A1L7X6J4_9HELO|nr:uncharacterized protein PAC_10528 [Phialocephala subalpina]
MQIVCENGCTGLQGTEGDKKSHLDNRNFWAQLMAIFAHTPPPRFVLHQPKVLQTDVKKNFNIDIRLEKAVHGYLSPDRKQRASLLVFGVQLICRRKETPFKRLELEARVMETQGRSASSRPEILSHAPFLTEEALKASKVQVKNTTQVENSANVDLDVGAAKISTGRRFTRGEELDSEDNYFGKGSSATIVDNDGKTSGIWWNVKQSSWSNAKDDAGIDPNYRFVVLLTRAKDDKAVFNVKFNLKIHAGLEYWLENSMSHATHIEDLSVDPRTWHVGECEAIDRESLGHFQKPENLTTLTKTAR